MLDTLLKSVVLRTPDKDALRCGDRNWSYQELDDAVERVSSGLAAAGVERGQHERLLGGSTENSCCDPGRMAAYR